MLMQKNIPNMVLTHILSNLVSIILLIIILIILVAKVSPVTPHSVYGSIDNNLRGNSDLKQYNLSTEPRITYLTQELVDAGNKMDANFFKDAKAGDLMLEYPLLTLIYDEKTKKVVGKFEMKATPADFAAKLSAHAEMKNYLSKSPQIILIDASNLASLGNQVQGLTQADIGNYLLAYSDVIFLYDYNNDKIKDMFTIGNAQQGAQPGAQQSPVQFDTNAPQDFFTKLLKHTEMKGLENTQPIGGRVTETALVQLKSLNPDLASKVLIGDFVLSYNDAIVIYNYEKDTIKGIYQLGQQ